MTCVIDVGFLGDNYGLEYPRIGWQRRGGSYAASTEAAGFAAVNAGTPRTDSFWKPTSLPGALATWTQTFNSNRTIGYIGIAVHDLATQNAVIRPPVPAQRRRVDQLRSWRRPHASR